MESPVFRAISREFAKLTFTKLQACQALEMSKETWRKIYDHDRGAPMEPFTFAIPVLSDAECRRQ